MLVWLPLAVSIMALVVSVASFVAGYWKNKRDAVWEYLKLLTSEDIVKVRAVVANAARSAPSVTVVDGVKHVNSSDWEALGRNRDAIFRLLWIVQMARPVAARNIQKKAIAKFEASEVYWHLDRMVPEVQGALDKWGFAFDASGSVDRANAALRSLDGGVKDEWDRTVAEISSAKISYDSPRLVE